MDKIAKKAKQKLMEAGTVTALDTQRKRERDPNDFLSKGKRSTARASNVGFETAHQRTSNALRIKQQQNTGKLGGGATNLLVKRRLGIVAGTEMNWKDKLVEKDAFDSEKYAFHASPIKRAQDRLRDANRGSGLKASMSTSSPHAKAAYQEKVRKSKQAADIVKALGGKHRQTKVRSERHAKQTDVKIAASTELDWTHKLVEHLIVEKDWIKGAVNPAHKGFCSPMTKSTCTPKRKALAKRFKKAGRKEKRSGGTGWEGKV